MIQNGIYRVRTHPGIYLILISFSPCFSIHPIKMEFTLTILKIVPYQAGSLDQTSSMHSCQNKWLYSSGIPNMMSLFPCFFFWMTPCMENSLLPPWLISLHVTGYYTNEHFWKLFTWRTHIRMRTHTQTVLSYLVL